MVVEAVTATKGIRMPQHRASSIHRRSNPPPRASRTVLSTAVILFAAASAAHAAGGTAPAANATRYFMPGSADSKIVTVANGETAEATSIVVLTEAVAVKETGPKPTIEHFGEIYAFSPAFIAVHRDEPTMITLWNLQPDDEHDFMLEDRPGHALMHLRLRPLSKISYIYTFHREGLFDFRCAVHQPEMNGQILVLPPR